MRPLHKIIPIICACLVIPSRLYLFYVMQHGADIKKGMTQEQVKTAVREYSYRLMQSEYSKDALLYLIIGLLLSTYITKDIRYNIILTGGKWLCYIMSVFLLNVFMPGFITNFAYIVSKPFYFLCAVASLINIFLIIRYFIKLTA